MSWLPEIEHSACSAGRRTSMRIPSSSEFSLALSSVTVISVMVSGGLTPQNSS